MMFSNTLKALGVVLLLGTISSAKAVTIDGTEYDKFLEVKVNDRLGYWISMKKFYTYDNKANSPINVSDTTFADPEFAGFDIGEFYTMGTTNTATHNAQINDGIVGLWGENGDLLLGGMFESNGAVETTRIRGRAGELTISGIFNVVDGTFFDLGLIDGPIYVNIAFDRIVGLGGNDTHAQFGTISFFRPNTTAVPEPSSVALLASSLLGFGRFGRKKKEQS